jgi:hypothetical protein
MQFIQRFLRNLGILIVLGIVLLLIYPNIMGQIYQTWIVLFGPGLVILMLVVAALPERRCRRY